MNEMNLEDCSPWVFFLGGLALRFFVGIFALIPLCIFRELKQNRRNRKYFLWGAMLFAILYTLLIILGIALLIAGVVGATSF